MTADRPLAEVFESSPGTAVSTTTLYRSEKHFVVCRTCRRRHAFYPDHDAHLRQQFEDFSERHPRHRGCYVYVLTPPQIEAMARRTEEKRRRERLSVLHYAHNSDVKTALQAEQTMTTTNLQSKTSSTTAGWTGNTVDNTSNLYVDTDIHVVIAAVNTAPANHKTIYVFAFAGTNSTDVTVTGAASGGTPGTEGSLTFPAIDTLIPCIPKLIEIPYPVQNAAIGGHRALSATYGAMPAFWGIAVLDYAGFTLAASGNTIKYRGVYLTVLG